MKTPELVRVRPFIVQEPIAEFHHPSGLLSISSNQKEDGIAGFYQHIQNNLCVFYRFQDRVFLYLSGKAIEINDQVQLEIKPVLTSFGRSQKFVIVVDDKISEIFIYRKPKRYLFHWLDLTPFTDNEDLDFLLFIHNVVADSDRLNWVLQKT